MPSEKIRCGSCQNGPFKRSFIESNDYEDNIIDGYWFCHWCLAYLGPAHRPVSKERLVARAEGHDIPRAFPDA